MPVVRIDSPKKTQPQRVLPYPEPIGEAGFYGAAGSFVRLVQDHTEADPNVLLLMFLTYAGNMMGRNAYLSAAKERHYSNINLCVVGPTSGGRKGTSFAPVSAFFEMVDPQWESSIQSGLSSGEGLIWAVRDPIPGKKDKKGKSEDDPGVSDKRLLVRESEFYSTLQACRRTGSTLSGTIRNAFDWGNLRIMTKNFPAKASGAHISLVGNITKEELLRGIVDEESDNGFANRFLWACSRRSRELPEGGELERVMDSSGCLELAQMVRNNSGDVRGPLERDEEAQDIWGRNGSSTGMYHELTKPQDESLFVRCTARSNAFVMRLSLIYALLDGAREIRREHQDAAAECWRYCNDSALYIFGGGMVDPRETKILAALRLKCAEEPGSGLTRNHIKRQVLGNNSTAEEVTSALNSLQSQRLAHCIISTGDLGRPAETWFLGPKPEEDL